MPPRTGDHFSPQTLLKHAYQDPAVCAELCTLFLLVAGEQLGRLESAVAAENVLATSHECHALKGSLLIAGAHAAVRMLDRIELEFNRKKLPCPRQEFLTLQAEMDATMLEVRRFLASSEESAAQL
ncbi:Hpt domain-containing protein [Collimonas sp.]|jgi:HPt (histidine-containing phosphotransfer) domain-containing protein|uniref:Hpt domain-containing protein n=1 Tax=Collimonas sp. TaxID=1963772 RepID=UPI002C44CA61|nr:Hpt domain-containing protein [Collimonas sp.]HWX00853.1 Hpt domain-containing protein [Collimonas sp.]